MSRLIHRPQAPLRPPVASSEPKIIREVISERVELRGEPGKDGDPGKDGQDGANAFPTGSQHVTAFYAPSRTIGQTGFTFEAVYGEGDKFLDIRKNSLILAPGHYRIIVAGELGTFSPIGMMVKVVKSNDPVNIGNMLPDVIELPRQIAPAISILKVGVTVEYVDNDAAG